MRLLCIAVKEGGYVLVGGAPPSPEKLARLVRCSVDEINEWLAELETESVFSRTGQGVIYSRRMVRDAKISQKNRENGAKGGNPNLRKQSGISQSDNPPATAPVKADKRKEEETIEERQASNDARVSKDFFGQAWSAFPEAGRRRSSTKKARTAWDRAATAAGGEAALLEAVVIFSGSAEATRDGGQFVPAMDRWLRDARWEHYRAGLFSRSGTTIDAPSERQQRSWMQDLQANEFSWRPERGPRPGQPGCRVDPAIQREFGFTPAQLAGAAA